VILPTFSANSLGGMQNRAAVEAEEEAKVMEGNHELQ
jgi:hypothetical protein